MRSCLNHCIAQIGSFRKLKIGFSDHSGSLKRRSGIVFLVGLGSDFLAEPLSYSSIRLDNLSKALVGPSVLLRGMRVPNNLSSSELPFLNSPAMPRLLCLLSLRSFACVQNVLKPIFHHALGCLTHCHQRMGVELDGTRILFFFMDPFSLVIERSLFGKDNV